MSGLLATLAVVTLLTSTDPVHAVAIDGDGAVWAGTDGGLVRTVDGHVTDTWTPGHGLPDGTVHAVLVEASDVWVGTDRGLALVDAGTGEVGATYPTASPVWGLARYDGDLHVGTFGDGLLRLRDGHLKRVASVPRITGLAAAGRLLYVTSTARGALVWDGRRMRRLGGDQLAWDVAVRGDDAWVATSRGLARYRAGRAVRDRAARASRRLPVADLRGVALDGDTPVVATYGAGVFRFEDGAWRAPGVAPAARATAVAAAAGRLAFGTDAGLFARGLDGTWRRSPAPALPDNDLTSLARTDEGLWVGTFAHGLMLLGDDGRTRRFDEARGLVDDRVNRLAVDAGGHLWVATDRGLVQRVGDRFVLRGLLDRHVTFVSAAGGRIYAGAEGDLWTWDGRALAPVDAGVPGRPQDVALDPRGELAVATAEGLAVRDAAGLRRMHTGDAGLPDDWVTATAAFDGQLVVGTYNAGIAAIAADGARDDALRRPGLWVNAGAMAAFDPGGVPELAVGTLDDGLWLFDGADWTQLTTEEGLPDDDVTAILPDGRGGLWVATRGGLAAVTVQEPAGGGSE